MPKFKQLNKKEKKDYVLPSYAIQMENKESLGVIIERVENILKNQEDNRIETKEDLTRIENHVIHTNGRVKRLELWKMFLAGAWAVISIALIPLAFFTFKDYLLRRDESIIQNQQYEQILKRIEISEKSTEAKIKDAIRDNNIKQFESFNE